jgi:hypothetical protein
MGTVWDATVVIADSESLTGGTAVTADVSALRTPAVLVQLEDLEGNAGDTVTLRVVGDVVTHTVDERTLSSTGSYRVDVPQCESVELESANGVTYAAEARSNPR